MLTVAVDQFGMVHENLPVFSKGHHALQTDQPINLALLRYPNKCFFARLLPEAIESVLDGS